MKLPARKSSLFLSLFLVVYGSLIVLRIEGNDTLKAISALLAIAAGAFIWLERPAN